MNNHWTFNRMNVSRGRFVYNYFKFVITSVNIDTAFMINVLTGYVLVTKWHVHFEITPFFYRSEID